ncbi:MAG TPA: endonuclease/exonuclease/phosphatase family protein [Oscillatoriaceae cyanobacterium]
MSISVPAFLSGASPYPQPTTYGSPAPSAPAYEAPASPDTAAWTVNLTPYMTNYQPAAPTSPYVPTSPYAPQTTMGESASQILTDVRSAAQQFMAWLKGATATTTPTTPTTTPTGPVAPPPSKPPVTAGGKTQFNVASFNVLGYAHTQPGGNEPWMGSGITRMDRAVQLIKSKNLDVVGFQEFEKPQAQEFVKQAGNEYALYPGLNKKIHDSENSIAWRKDKWDLVKAQTFPVHYFNGNIRHVPIVLLRDKQTGQEVYFVNTHNPADTKQHPNQGKWRAADMPIEASVMNQLKASGLPVIFTGDFNDKQGMENLDHAGTNMHSSSALSNGKLRKGQGIDWILGSSGVQFSNYVKDRGAFVKKTTDHPVVSATVTVG